MQRSFLVRRNLADLDLNGFESVRPPEKASLFSAGIALQVARLAECMALDG